MHAVALIQERPYFRDYYFVLARFNFTQHMTMTIVGRLTSMHNGEQLFGSLQCHSDTVRSLEEIPEKVEKSTSKEREVYQKTNGWWPQSVLYSEVPPRSPINS